MSWPLARPGITEPVVPLEGVNVKKGDPKLREAAIRVFGDESLAEHWLTTPLLALADKSPVDADTEDALELLARLEHGFCA